MILLTKFLFIYISYLYLYLVITTTNYLHNILKLRILFVQDITIKLKLSL